MGREQFKIRIQGRRRRRASGYMPPLFQSVGGSTIFLPSPTSFEKKILENAEFLARSKIFSVYICLSREVPKALKPNDLFFSFFIIFGRQF